MPCITHTKKRRVSWTLQKKDWSYIAPHRSGYETRVVSYTHSCLHVLMHLIPIDSAFYFCSKKRRRTRTHTHYREKKAKRDTHWLYLLLARARSLWQQIIEIRVLSKTAEKKSKKKIREIPMFQVISWLKNNYGGTLLIVKDKKKWWRRNEWYRMQFTYSIRERKWWIG